MNFNIQQGERVAFIGKTGSSKSTIAELILRTMM
ncbi:MAG: ATP-binding cassette domain-containing protein [Chitinophagales bacterium]